MVSCELKSHDLGRQCGACQPAARVPGEVEAERLRGGALDYVPAGEDGAGGDKDAGAAPRPVDDAGRGAYGSVTVGGQISSQRAST